MVPTDNTDNLEDWILSRTGREIYEIFIEGYTKKQWGIPPKSLPASIIKRIPIRLTYDDNYFDDTFQGIPIGGYTNMMSKMLEGIEIRLNVDYFDDKNFWDSSANTIIYTGRVDKYFNYEFGELEYRGLRFKEKLLKGDYQGNAVINYTDSEIPFTRVIEHKHFELGNQPLSVVTWEYPEKSYPNTVPFYPINTEKNKRMCNQYKAKAKTINNLVLGGRLATYQYLDMDSVILLALALADNLLSK